MGYNRIAALCAAIVALALGWATAAGGSASDPVITRSYLQDTVKPAILEGIAEKVERKLSDPTDRIIEISWDMRDELSQDGVISSTAEVALEELQAQGDFWYSAAQMRSLTLSAGQVICGEAGTKVIVFEGAGQVYGNPVVNITSGYEYAAGSKIQLNNTYFFTANDGSGLRFTSNSRVGVQGRYKILDAVRVPRYTDLAEALQTMGLVKGASGGFELYRGATRAEAVTMLVRLLAEESISNQGGRSHPFKDVDAWANNVVAYALEKGYANGTSKTTFSASSPTTVNHYMTFLLRALGYNDQAGDFKWDQAMDAAVQYGVITQAERDKIFSTPFTRDHMVYLSYYALLSNRKGQSMTLLESLIERGAVSQSAADSAINSVSRTRG